MLDRIIQEVVASFCSWRVDMGLITPTDNRPVNQSAPSSPKGSSTTNLNNTNITKSNPHHPQSSIEDPEYFQRIMQSRYPEHMLHCPQTSLYPIFFFLMERWEARRAAAKQNMLSPSPTNTASDSPNE